MERRKLNNSNFYKNKKMKNHQKTRTRMMKVSTSTAKNSSKRTKNRVEPILSS